MSNQFEKDICYICNKPVTLSGIYKINGDFDEDSPPIFININAHNNNAPTVMKPCHADCSPFKYQTKGSLDDMVKHVLKIASTPYWTRKINQSVDSLKETCRQVEERSKEISNGKS